jgi:hypothetical protein
MDQIILAVVEKRTPTQPQTTPVVMVELLFNGKQELVHTQF